MYQLVWLALTIVKVCPGVVGLDEEPGGVEDGETVHDVGAQVRLEQQSNNGALMHLSFSYFQGLKFYHPPMIYSFLNGGASL